MFSRLWKGLILALCSTAGIACSHQYNSTGSETVAQVNPAEHRSLAGTPAAQPCSACASKTAQPCAACAGKPAAQPCATCAGKPAAQPCGTCAGKTMAVDQPLPVVAVKPCLLGKGRCYVMTDAANCKSCQTATKTVVAAPASGCSSCQTAKNALAAKNVPVAPAPPQRLDMVIVAPQKIDEHVVNKPDYMAAPKELRDPATGAVRYDHARDYSWVVGQLEYLHSKHQWRVRYSPYDVEDEFGGVVSLTGIDHLSDRFQNGMVVRVQGQIVNSEARKSSTEYYVYDLKVIQ